MFPYEFCEIFKNAFVTEHLQAAASELKRQVTLTWWFKPLHRFFSRLHVLGKQ